MFLINFNCVVIFHFTLFGSFIVVDTFSVEKKSSKDKQNPILSDHFSIWSTLMSLHRRLVVPHMIFSIYPASGHFNFKMNFTWKKETVWKKLRLREKSLLLSCPTTRSLIYSSCLFSAVMMSKIWNKYNQFFSFELNNRTSIVYFRRMFFRLS